MFYGKSIDKYYKLDPIPGIPLLILLDKIRLATNTIYYLLSNKAENCIHILY